MLADSLSLQVVHHDLAARLVLATEQCDKIRRAINALEALAQSDGFALAAPVLDDRHAPAEQNGHAVPAPPPRTPVAGPPRKKRQQHPGKARGKTESQGKARAMFESGHAIAQIAEACGVSGASVYGWRARYGWTRGSPGKGAAAQQQPEREKASPAVVDDLVGLRRRCQSCQQITTKRPCAHCGVA